VLAVHTAEYVDGLRQRVPEYGYHPIDPDTMMNPHTLQAAVRAAGAGVAAVDALMDGLANTAFCALRPPAHDGEPDKAEGFCLLDNIAIPTRHSLDRHRLERIALIGFGLHHGNGTESAFANDERVLMCGFFQHPFYPYSGFR